MRLWTAWFEGCHLKACFGGCLQKSIRIRWLLILSWGCAVMVVSLAEGQVDTQSVTDPPLDDVVGTKALFG